jgi:translocation and assembly module TamB
LSTRNLRAFAGYAITPQRIHIFSIKANLFGGELTGDAEVNNWQTSFTSETKGRRRLVSRGASNAVQTGAIRLQVAGFPIYPGLEYISSKDLPLNHLGLAADASGNVDIIWTGAIRDADTRLNLSLTTPSKTAANEIPLHGQVDLIYKGAHDDLEVTQLHAVTPASELDAAGSLSANPSLHFTVTSHNVKEVTPLLQAAFMSQNLPFVIHGWATLSGIASGKLSALAVNGNLAAYDFDTKLPGQERTAVRAVHWDALSAAVQISNSHLGAHNGVLVHNHTRIRFNASSALNHGRFATDGPFAADFDVRNADVAEVNQLTGLNRPLSGMVNLTGNMSGTRENIRGDGHLEFSSGSIYSVAIPLAKSDWEIAGDEVRFNNLQVAVFDSNLSGSAAINTSDIHFSGTDWAKSRFHFDLAGKNLRLSHLPRMQNSRFRADGIADFTLRASGSVEKPALEAHVHLKDLAFDQQRVGDFYVDAVTRGRQLELNAHSEFEKAVLTIGGSVGLDHDFPADLSLAFNHLDADSLLRVYFPGKGVGQSRVAGTLHVRGPLRNPSSLKAFAEIQTLNVDMEHVHLQNVGPLRFEVADQTMLLEDFHLSGSGTDFTAHGQAHLAGARELDVQMEGSVNMGLLQSFYPKILARGNLGINLTAQGTMSQPIMRGRLEVKNTFVSHNDFPSGLSDLNGALSFEGNRVQIDHLSGTTGGGVIALNGTATYQSGALLLDLGATAQDVRLRYPPGVSSTANANLRLTGSTNAALLSGDVVVTKLAITPGFDFGAYIERNRQSIVLTQSESLQSRLKLDVHVATTPELQMQTAIARLSGNADLRLRGTAERPAILGRVEVLEGEVTFNGTKYSLDRGDVTFANPAKTQPVIDLQATTRVRDYDITVQLRGDASVANGVKVTWQSEPQLPEADVIALLALGRTQEESAAAAQGGGFGFGGDASNLLINEALNSTLNSRLQKLFGASRVKIDPQGLASETNVIRGPQVTVEQEVASKLTLTYSTNVSVSNQQIIQAEYHLTRNVSIVALRDQNGVVSFDFKLRRRKK